MSATHPRKTQKQHTQLWLDCQIGMISEEEKIKTYITRQQILKEAVEQEILVCTQLAGR